MILLNTPRKGPPLCRICGKPRKPYRDGRNWAQTCGDERCIATAMRTPRDRPPPPPQPVAIPDFRRQKVTYR